MLQARTEGKPPGGAFSFAVCPDAFGHILGLSKGMICSGRVSCAKSLFTPASRQTSKRPRSRRGSCGRSPPGPGGTSSTCTVKQHSRGGATHGRRHGSRGSHRGVGHPAVLNCPAKLEFIKSYAGRSTYEFEVRSSCVSLEDVLIIPSLHACLRPSSMSPRRRRELWPIGNSLVIGRQCSGG